MNPFKEKGTPLEKQVRSWKQVAQPPFRKQEVDAFTRCRVILMNGIELEASVFSHNFARMETDEDLKKTAKDVDGVTGCRRMEAVRQERWKYRYAIKYGPVRSEPRTLRRH